MGIVIYLKRTDKTEYPCQWYRIYAELDDPFTSEKESHKYDKLLLNPLKAKNFYTLIIYNNEILQTIYCPNYIGGKYWDIGLLNLSSLDFILMNSIISFLPSRIEFMSEYIQLSHMLSGISKSKVSSIFSIIIRI